MKASAAPPPASQPATVSGVVIAPDGPNGSCVRGDAGTSDVGGWPLAAPPEYALPRRQGGTSPAASPRGPSSAWYRGSPSGSVRSGSAGCESAGASSASACGAGSAAEGPGTVASTSAGGAAAARASGQSGAGGSSG